MNTVACNKHIRHVSSLLTGRYRYGDWLRPNPDAADVHETVKGEWDKSSWLNDKEWLQQDFPLLNLPFLVDCAEDRVISQTNAILSHLGRELNMLGSSVQETAQCEELLCEIMDLRNSMVKFAYGTTSASTSTAQHDAAKLLTGANVQLKKLERWLIREYPEAFSRVVDNAELDTIGFHTKGVCHLWEMLDQFEGLCKHYGLPSCLGTTTTCSDQVVRIQTSVARTAVFPHLKEFHESFVHLLANRAYATMNRLNGAVDDSTIELPYNNPAARFGSTLGTSTPRQKARGRILVFGENFTPGSTQVLRTGAMKQTYIAS